MRFLDLTFESPEENLACDEALLGMCEEGFDEEILRFWESRKHFVVLGYSNRVHSEVHVQYCTQNSIPVLRRCTGGGAVVQGPGCVNYSLILRISGSGPLQTIAGTNRYILTLHRNALASIIDTPVDIQGSSDLALGSMKFSGNAQRRAKRCMLVHGTFLLDFDLSLVPKVLLLPSRQPPYRRNRSHDEFLMNLSMERDDLKNAIRHTWDAREQLHKVPSKEMRELVRTRYSTSEWTFRL